MGIHTFEARNRVPPPTPELSAALQRAAQLIQSNERFLVSGHAHPDGDAIGSTLALYHLLRALGKEVIAFNVDPVPFNLNFLPGADQVVSVLPDDARFDVACLLDCHEKARAGDRFPENGWGESLLVIDHHRLKETPADVLVHDERAAATAELVYRLARTLNAPMIPELVECIYCAIVTDTGGFRYSNTSPTAMSIAADLIAHGVDVWHITSHIYESNPVERLQLLAEVLGTLEQSRCKRLAVLRISAEMMARYEASESMLDGFINHARSIRGVEVAAQLREQSDGSYRISFRSRGRVDVSEIAMRFGGGGHRNAAGCTIEGSWTKVIEHLNSAIDAVLGPIP